MFPLNRTLCPASPSLQWVPWVSVPHLPELDFSLANSSVLCSATTANSPSRVPSLSLVPRYPAFSSFFFSCPVFLGSLFGLEFPCQRLGSCLSSVPLLLTYGKETIGSPKFPRCPRKHMPRSQTPVVSYALAISCPGLLPSGHCTPSAFPLLLRLKRLSFRPRLYTFRGSITRPAPLFPSASYSRYRVCT
jgi:hypothetical protein